MAIRIFISYAREDYASAKKLFDHLKKIEGLDPWLDKENLLPGMDWKQGIMVALRESRFVILLLSPCLVNKAGYIQREIKETLERLSAFPAGSIFLIPARIEECTPKDEELLKINWVDMFPDWEEGFKKILKAIEYETKKNDLREKETKEFVAESINRNFSIDSERISVSETLRILDSTREFSGLDMMDLDLRGLDFSKADLHGANLVGANLSNCSFLNANLKAANLERADLSFSNLKGANLWGVNLWRANFQSVNCLDEAILKHTNFYGVKQYFEERFEEEKVGFGLNEIVFLEDYGTFIRYFREKVGMSPDRLRDTFLWLRQEYFVSMLLMVY